MTDELRTTDCVSPASPTPESPDASSANRPFKLGLLGLLLGIVAIGLASIPGLALGRPLPNPFAAKPEPPRVPPPAEREGGITLKFKALSVNVGGKVPKDKAVAKPEPPLELTKDPIRWFTISAMVCALVGLLLAALSQLRERHLSLTVSSMGCCVAAITWQYFAVGIAIGAAAAAFLIVLALLGSLVP